MTKVDVDKLGELDLEAKKIKKELDKGKAQLKESDEKEFVGNKFKAVISERTTTKLNIDKALSVIKDNDMKFLIKETVDEDKLNDALMTGEVDPTLFVDCVSSSTTKAVTFRKV